MCSLELMKTNISMWVRGLPTLFSCILLCKEGQPSKLAVLATQHFVAELQIHYRTYNTNYRGEKRIL